VLLLRASHLPLSKGGARFISKLNFSQYSIYHRRMIMRLYHLNTQYYIYWLMIFSYNSCFPLVNGNSPFSWAILYKSTKLSFPFSNSFPLPESKELYRSWRIFSYAEEEMILSAVSRPLAKVSAPPIWAWKISSRSVEFLLILASKFTPPPCSPPALRNTSMASVVSSRLLGNWSVSHPFW